MLACQKAKNRYISNLELILINIYMTEQIVAFLKISALVFFNLFCLIGILIGIVVIGLLMKIRSTASNLEGKVTETLNTIQEAAVSAGENGLATLGMIAPMIIPFLFRGKRGGKGQGFFGKFFNKK